MEVISLISDIARKIVCKDIDGVELFFVRKLWLQS
jgi:hypothetical protein